MWLAFALMRVISILLNQSLGLLAFGTQLLLHVVTSFPLSQSLIIVVRHSEELRFTALVWSCIGRVAQRMHGLEQTNDIGDRRTRQF